MADRMRLDKLLSFLGVGSRSQVRGMVFTGRVTVGECVERNPGLQVDPTVQSVAVDGQPLAYQRYRHVMLNKPSDVLTAASDARAQTVMDLLPAPYHGCGCMPVGRLDKDTEGLLLLTNDGELAHRILSPKSGVDKVYAAWVDGPLDEQDVAAFAAGLTLSDFAALPAALTVRHSTPEAALALCTVQEGKFHQVKRMFAARGRTVTALKRLSVGPVTLDEALAPGTYRELTPEEANALYAAVRLTPP